MFFSFQYWTIHEWEIDDSWIFFEPRLRNFRHKGWFHNGTAGVSRWCSGVAASKMWGIHVWRPVGRFAEGGFCPKNHVKQRRIHHPHSILMGKHLELSNYLGDFYLFMTLRNANIVVSRTVKTNSKWRRHYLSITCCVVQIFEWYLDIFGRYAIISACAVGAELQEIPKSQGASKANLLEHLALSKRGNLRYPIFQPFSWGNGVLQHFSHKYISHCWLHYHHENNHKSHKRPSFRWEIRSFIYFPPQTWAYLHSPCYNLAELILTWMCVTRGYRVP